MRHKVRLFRKEILYLIEKIKPSEQITINKDFRINENGELEVFPTAASSHTDFDFYILIPGKRGLS